MALTIPHPRRPIVAGLVLSLGIVASVRGEVITIDFNGVDASAEDAWAVPSPPPPIGGTAPPDGASYLAQFGVSVEDVTGTPVYIRNESNDFFDAIHSPSNALVQDGRFADEWVGYTLVFDRPVVQVDIYFAPIDEDLLADILLAFPEFAGLEDLFYPAFRVIIDPEAPEPITAIEQPELDFGDSFGFASGPSSAAPYLLGDAIPANAPTFTRLRIEGNATGTALFNNVVIDTLVVYTVPEPGVLLLTGLGVVLCCGTHLGRKFGRAA